MKKSKNNTLEYLYQEFQIHFMVHGSEKQVMVNATEMAKAFGKRTNNYLRNQETKKLINQLEQTRIVAHSTEKIIDDRGHMGIYFCDVLAIDFAAWLDVEFRLWIYKKIIDLTLGEYKRHFDAHLALKKEEVIEKELRILVTKEPTADNYKALVDSLDNQKRYRNQKRKAIDNQLKMKL